MNAAIKSTFRPESTKSESLSLTEENGRLKDENTRLRSENEQLRRIFDDAVDQFDRLKKEIEKLGGELEDERNYRKELEKQNERLKKEFKAEKGKANKFADMLFGLKSEKLKLSDIEIQDGNTLLIEEESETEISLAEDEKTGKGADRREGDDGASDEEGEPATDKREKKKSGGQSGHAGSGRKIPEGLPVVDRIVTLPEGESIHGIPAENWIEQKCMEETSILIRKKVEWYIERIVRRKYAPPEGVGPDVPKIITAPMPDKLIPQGKYAMEVWLDILIEKFQQHVPIQRQIFAAQQAGVNLIPGTVFGGLKNIYETHLKPLYEQLIVELRKAEHWHADETRWYMLRDALKKLWYMWGFKFEDKTSSGKRTFPGIRHQIEARTRQHEERNRRGTRNG